MTRRAIHVIYRVMDTTVNAHFTADHSCITMTPHSTGITLKGGKEIDSGRPVHSAIYRDACAVVIYLDGES